MILDVELTAELSMSIQFAPILDLTILSLLSHEYHISLPFSQLMTNSMNPALQPEVQPEKIKCINEK